MIERSFAEGIALLETHLAAGPRPFLLGSRVSWGDFGLAAQIYEALIDPTGGLFLRTRAPRVLEWCTKCMYGKVSFDLRTEAVVEAIRL